MHSDAYGFHTAEREQTQKKDILKTKVFICSKDLALEGSEKYLVFIHHFEDV